MGPDALELVKLMFNENEHICVSDSKYAYASSPIKIGTSQEVPLISNNPDIPTRIVDGSKLILMAINPMKEGANRQDSNVSAFRSFLVEMDVGDRDTQINTLAHYGFPFSAQIWSGSKSIHTITTLSEDLNTEKEYRIIADWIFNIITYADRNCANVSRSVRIPNAIRPETGKEQELIELKSRITHKELFDWLNKYPHLRPKAKEKRIIPEGQYDFSRLSPWARGMLTKGIDFKRGRNQTWYALAMDFALAGATEEVTIEILGKHFQEEHDFKEKEWLTTIASAFKTVSEGRS
jgi:hypothetical protein